MDWKDVAPVIGAVAPTVGKIIGGLLPLPFGYAIGEHAGRAVAAALGVDSTPEAVSAAAAGMSQAELTARLAATEKGAVAQYQAMAEMAKADAAVQIEQVKATAGTMATELVQGNFLQRLWRPIAMCVWVATWPMQLGGLFYMILNKDPAVASSVPALVTALAAWNAAPAALAGVYSWGRSQEKIAAAQSADDQ